uniref:Rab-GAP TBC domain-containing protein n=1 Tax=Strongyloides venezuelensis TaxID=75913 RepID=A0A0K0G601_STRVS
MGDKEIRKKNIDNLIKNESPNNNLRNEIVKYFIPIQDVYMYFFDYSVINLSEDLMVIILNFLQLNLICDKMFMPKENKLLYQFLLLLTGSPPSKSVKNREKQLDDAQLLVEYYNSYNYSL